MVVYADIVFFVNFISAFLLLSVGRIIFNMNRKTLRVILASLLCGVYSVCEILLGLPFALRIVVLTVMCMISFGISCLVLSTLRIMFLSVALLVAVVLISNIFGVNASVSGGLVTVFSKGYIMGIIYGVSYPMVMLVIKCVRSRSDKRRVVLRFGRHRLKTELLYDSGNLLTYKGISVAVLSWEAVRHITGFDTYTDFCVHCEDTVIFSGVHGAGILPLMRPDRCLVDGTESDIYVAVSERGYGGFSGIIGDIKRVGEEIKCNF